MGWRSCVLGLISLFCHIIKQICLLGFCLWSSKVLDSFDHKMADPDIVNAFLGATVGSAVVGPIFQPLFDGLKAVIHCKSECATLREELEMLQPMLKEIVGRHKENTTLRNWLMIFGRHVAEAQEILEACKNTNSKVWERYAEVRYGVAILDLQKKIQADVSKASMALLSLQSGSSKPRCWIEQEVPQKILGMEDHFKKVKSLILEGHKNEVNSCELGIRGMGGAGKTLLAQMLNNDKEIQEAFGVDSVIWITVGLDAEVSVLYDRMRKLLQVEDGGGSIEDQRTELRNAFLQRKVLLILDDVWDGVLHKREEMVEWVNIAKGPGSVTLLTTRNKSVIDDCGIAAQEEVILHMSEDESWELFCTHAYGIDIPILDKDIEGVARDVCKECKCLPLALKVIGRAMRRKRDIQEWRRTLFQLQAPSKVNKSVDEQLFRPLRFSYDQLDEIEKTCFEYFAAFPEDCEIPIEDLCKIWVVEGLFGEDLDVVDALDAAYVAVNELLRRTLIERCGVNSCATLRVKMHDLLRDLAIQIASDREECDQESLFAMVKKDVKEFPSAWLGKKMKAKRLSMWVDKIKRFPSDFIAPELKICMLYSSPWGSSQTWCFAEPTRQHFKPNEAFFENLKALRYLQICGNGWIWRLPESMGELGLLQHLDLSRCVSMKKLAKSMGRLRSLQHLDLSNCRSLELLPEDIGDLGSLKHLDLSGCHALMELPKSMGGLGSLQHLDLSHCAILEQLPEDIGELGSLKHFDLSWCNALKELPKSMGGLGSLQHLDLFKCEILEQLPEDIGELGSLQYLNLSWCSALKDFRKRWGRFGSLQYLNLSHCKGLEELPKDVGDLGSLEYLNLSWCFALKELPKNMGRLRSLQYLDLSYCKDLELLPEDIGDLGSLKHLDLSGCGALKELPKSMGRLGSLQYLNLSVCIGLEQLPEDIGELGSLQHLDLSLCFALKELPKSMGRLESLQFLDLSNCEASPLDFPKLKQLQIIFGVLLL